MDKKQCSRSGHFILCLMFLLSFALLAGCQSSSSVTITIADKEVKLDGELQDCIDNGLITTNVSGDKTELTTNMEAREASFSTIRLGNSTYPRKCPVYVALYNPSSSRKSVYECRIMTFYYNPEFDSADQVQVLINGIDFWGMTEDDALAALEKQGFKVDYDKMHESHYNSFKKGKVSWKLESEPGSCFSKESENPLKAVVDFEDDTYYISSVKLDISGTLNLKSK